MGVLGEAAGQHIAPHVPTFLQALSSNCIGTKRDTQSAVDNACGAVARLILAVPASVPLASVVPVLLQNLPLTEDTNENSVVYQCIDAIARHEQGFSFIQPALPHLLAAFCHAAALEQIEPESAMLFAALCQWMSQVHAGTFHAAVAGLAPEHAAIMQQASAALAAHAAAEGAQ
jgi:importin-4